jgi:hypothetical protein
MMSDLIVIYLGGWVVMASALFIVTSHFADFRSPASHPFGMSVLAGAVWPFLIVGMAEFGSLAACAKVRSMAEPEPHAFV